MRKSNRLLRWLLENSTFEWSYYLTEVHRVFFTGFFLTVTVNTASVVVFLHGLIYIYTRGPIIKITKNETKLNRGLKSLRNFFVYSVARKQTRTTHMQNLSSHLKITWTSRYK